MLLIAVVLAAIVGTAILALKQIHGPSKHVPLHPSGLVLGPRVYAAARHG